MGFDQLLVIQAQAQMSAAQATVLRKANTAVRVELPGLDLADCCLNQATEFLAPFVGIRGLQELDLETLFPNEATMAISGMPVAQEYEVSWGQRQNVMSLGITTPGGFPKEAPLLLKPSRVAPVPFTTSSRPRRIPCPAGVVPNRATGEVCND
jgi:hypothetical protein